VNLGSAKSYPAPLDTLLERGDDRGFSRDPAEWPDYVGELGLGPGHVPELARMVADDELNLAPTDDSRVWAPLHAWRALGQLRAADGVEPLIGYLDTASERDEDLALEQIPVVLAMIGRPALEPLVRFLGDAGHELWARVAAASALGKLAAEDPSTRDEVVAALASALERHAEQDDMLNAYLVYPLMDLRAVEAAPVMQRAFENGDVAVGVNGDWEDVQIELGLLEERLTPRPRYSFLPELDRIAKLGEARRPVPADRRRSDAGRSERRRKQAKQSRKRNRKRG
jgi:hypothetical protein